jgi:FkbM family methyltransferase
LSAYYGDAETYAFEPVKSSFEMLKKTAALSKNIIHPVQKGLGNSDFETTISLSERSGSESALKNNNTETTEIIKLTTLDKFVKDEGLKKIDFIKADIEGMERELLMGGAANAKSIRA